MIRRLGLGAAFALAAVSAQGAPSEARIVPFSQLDGWSDDDHDAALSVFSETCDLIGDPSWAPLCALAREAEVGSGRVFFEAFFRPVRIGQETALFTGYYEPEIEGSLRPGGPYRYPLYRRPAEVRPGRPWATRAEIEGLGLLRGRGLELVWLADPVERFFLQIQGSGRIRLPDGEVMRVGFGGKNGQPYRSVGQEMIRRGLLRAHEASADRIKAWVRARPDDGRRLLWHNPSYVFFREVTEVPPEKGPIGAMGRSVTKDRSIAVDPEHVPLGAPVWIEKDGRTPIRRLTVAQDTGGAIQGAQRADIFFGTGDAAGDAAGRLKDPGRMIVLLPIELAYARAPES